MTTDHVDPSDPAARELVANGKITPEGRLVDASNVTLLCWIELDGVTAHAVYKPISGEEPLWDFPDGTLAGREVATYLIAEATGLGRVPPTVLRDGPFGEGMVQLWIDSAEDNLVTVSSPNDVPDDWRVVLHAQDRLGEPAVLAHSAHPEVHDLAVLDVIVNNTDRKGGHVLHSPAGRVYGVDHGICLHSRPKLRTVLWGWIGEPLPSDTMDKLHTLRSVLDHDLGHTLAQHLTEPEVWALSRRTEQLLSEGVFPKPDDTWSVIPWPLF